MRETQCCRRRHVPHHRYVLLGQGFCEMGKRTIRRRCGHRVDESARTIKNDRQSREVLPNLGVSLRSGLAGRDRDEIRVRSHGDDEKGHSLEGRAHPGPTASIGRGSHWKFAYRKLRGSRLRS